MYKIFDVHTHLNPVALGAKGLRNIIGYHFLLSEVISCGSKVYSLNCKDDDIWMELFIPYLKYISNTSSYWMTKKILSDLYSLEIEKLNLKNWKDYDTVIKGKYQKIENWEWKILTEKCKIGKFFTSRDFPDNFKNIAEAEIVGRTYEKINLGISKDISYIKIWESILNEEVELEKIKKYLKREVKKVIEDNYYAFVFWAGRYCFENISEKEIAEVLNSNDEEKIRNKLSCYVFQTVLEEIFKYSKKPVIQLIIGAYVKEIPETKYSRIFDITPSDILYSYQKLFDQFSNLKFDILISSSIRSKELDTIARMCPNVSLSGTWLHTMFANDIKRIFSSRLDFVPIYKLNAFLSDAYNSEWVYGKLSLLKKCVEEVIDKKIKDNWIEDKKEDILKVLFWENPARIYSISER